jgi:hypothetical protein
VLSFGRVRIWFWPRLPKEKLGLLKTSHDALKKTTQRTKNNTNNKPKPKAEPRAQLSLASRGASTALKIGPSDLVLYSAKVTRAACFPLALVLFGAGFFFLRPFLPLFTKPKTRDANTSANQQPTQQTPTTNGTQP